MTLATFSSQTLGCGTLVYCSWGAIDGNDLCPSKLSNDEGWANDFALVELPDDFRHLVHPWLLHWGGPTGMVKSPPGAEVHVLTFGNSSLCDAGQEGSGSDAADAREGMTTSPVQPRYLPHGPRTFGSCRSAYQGISGARSFSPTATPWHRQRPRRL
jgi:hypothetical protein